MPLKTLARHCLCLCALIVSIPAVQAQQTYADHPAARAFAARMATDHGLSEVEVLDTFSKISQDDRVIRLITPPTRKGVRSWARYRRQFIEPVRINRGIEFWQENAAELARASQQFGVPAEIIVAIIGVETIYGRNTGNFTTASALATLAFDYPPRAQLFSRELENLFLLAREQRRDPLAYEGSYAGALGYPQFLPSSVRAYAVDFDGDGHIDLENSPSDAIGSVANYLAAHGWQPGGTIAVRAHVESPEQVTDLIDHGIEPAFAEDDFVTHKVLPLGTVPAGARAALIDLITPDAATEYWLGFQNFYVITRYNRSSFYAMAVFELGEALRSAHTETTVSAAAGTGR